ncbi:hypothetical protein KP509_24G068800 [Ceratopteris richardii]|uniref:Uncharacterized protein n=1 Tax=Ceratopteris richardii TaxID=49495 RepID=A0A8T2RW58_CERRI|nr:hypothetical protein KP509_24G068800 [Ceratopteris richardii]
MAVFLNRRIVRTMDQSPLINCRVQPKAHPQSFINRRMYRKVLFICMRISLSDKLFQLFPLIILIVAGVINQIHLHCTHSTRLYALTRSLTPLRQLNGLGTSSYLPQPWLAKWHHRDATIFIVFPL